MEKQDMEGVIHLHKGFLSGFKPYFAALEKQPPIAYFVLRRKAKDGSEKMRLNLSGIQVFAIECQSNQELLLVDPFAKK